MNLPRGFATAALVALIFTSLAVPDAHATPITIDWVRVGNPGNTNDTTDYGAVAEAYRIMKFHFTNTQYAAFLNAIDPAGENPNQVYSTSMGSDALGGITRDLLKQAGSRYEPKPNMGNRPVNFVSWFNAARVANWMHNGAQTYGSTDATASAPQNTGAYTLGTATSGNAPAKNSGALYWLPTENEWYKAAYYSPVKGGVGSPGYYLYGNGFDSGIATVTADSSGNGSAGTGIMGSGTGNFANFDFGAGNVTTVGTNGAASYYGAFDMSGNVWDWNDLDGVSGSSRGLRGGSWRDNASDVSSAARATNLASGGRNDFIGFRLASVPEPATLGMASGGALCAGGWWVLKRRRKRA